MSQTSKNNKETLKQDPEVSFESKNLNQEKSNHENKTNIINEPIFTDATSAKKVLIGIPSIRIPKKMAKLKGSARGGRTENIRKENDECSDSNSSESNGKEYEMHALKQNIEVKIKGTKPSYINSQMREIDANTVKSILSGIKVTIRIPSIKIVDKSVKFRNIGTKPKTGNSKMNENDDDKVETIKEHFERSNENTDEIQNVKNQQKSDVESSAQNQTVQSKIRSSKNLTKINTKISKPLPALNETKRKIGIENKMKRLSKNKMPLNSLTGAKMKQSFQLAKNASVIGKPKAKKKVSMASKASKPEENRIPVETDRFEDNKTRKSIQPTKSIEKRRKQFQTHNRLKAKPK